MGPDPSNMSAGLVLQGFRALVEQLDQSIVRSFVADIDWTMPERPLVACSLPCIAYLARAAAIATGPGVAAARLLCEHGPSLRWGQTYNAADFGEHFLRNYGWTEIFGTRGHFMNDRVAGGFLLLGPHVTYPDHHHVAEEIYVPLTGGSEWRMGGDEFGLRAAGDVIHHASDVSHAMRTADEPLLALYLWRGGPLDQRSVIGASTTVGKG